MKVVWGAKAKGGQSLSPRSGYTLMCHWEWHNLCVGVTKNRDLQTQRCECRCHATRPVA